MLDSFCCELPSNSVLNLTSCISFLGIEKTKSGQISSMGGQS